MIAPTVQKAQEGTLVNDLSKGLWDTTEKVRVCVWMSACMHAFVKIDELCLWIWSLLGASFCVCGRLCVLCGRVCYPVDV